ncbi:MAG: MarC family protein [Candidatus Caldarchaeales archaeon]
MSDTIGGDRVMGAAEKRSGVPDYGRPDRRYAVLISVTSELIDRERNAAVNTTVNHSSVPLVLFPSAGGQLMMLFGVWFEGFLSAGGSALTLLAVKMLFHGGEGWRVSGESIRTFSPAFLLIAGPEGAVLCHEIDRDARTALLDPCDGRIVIR